MNALQHQNPFVVVNNILIDASLVRGDVTIPDNVTSISHSAFYGNNNITSVTMGKNVTAIKDRAFANCSNLTKVTIGEKVTSIEFEAFANCNELSKITIGKSLSSVGLDVFNHCEKIATVEIPDNVTCVNKDTFSAYGYNPVIIYLHLVSGVTLNCDKMTMKVNEIKTLTATVIPENATNKNVIWNSSNPSVASVANGAVIAKKAGTATITATSVDGDFQSKCVVKVIKPKVFSDVPSGSYYGEAVDWAVENEVTSGTSDSTFSPDMVCSRGQCVTFLYRAAGSPSVSGIANPFTDVKASDYYYKAVLWAYKNNITTGTSATNFSPDAECSRGQVVTFLWRSVGKPKGKSNNPFSDIDLTQYYGNAVLWAVENNITTGTSKTTFSPGMACSRAQIVTFLYRFFV